VLSNSEHRDSGQERVALKDERLVYRACSMAFAKSLGMSSPVDVIGKTDFDLFPGHVARQQISLDSRAMHSAEADISAIALGSSGNQVVIVRTPVLSADQKVQGIDVRLLSGTAANAPPSAFVVDYQTLVNDGIQGNLIFSDDSILFANFNAAQVLGFPDVRTITEQGQVKELFSEVELARIFQRAKRETDPERAQDENLAQRLTLSATTRGGQSVRLISRVAHVQWGAALATLLSFVDIAMPRGIVPKNPTPKVNVEPEPEPVPDPSPVPALAPEAAPKPDSQPEAEVETEQEPEHRPLQNGESKKSPSIVADIGQNSAAKPAANIAQFPASQSGSERRPLVPSDFQKLRVSEQRFRHYARAAADFFWELDEKLMFRFVSEDLARVLGIPRHHLVGRTHRQLIDHPSNINDLNHWNEQLERLNEVLAAM